MEVPLAAYVGGGGKFTYAAGSGTYSKNTGVCIGTADAVATAMLGAKESCPPLDVCVCACARHVLQRIKGLYWQLSVVHRDASTSCSKTQT